LAHGRNAPVATNFQAKVDHGPTGVEAKVVDGDRKLWLRAPSSSTLIVLGFQREPYIRFDPAGVELNLRSPTTYLNQPRLQYASRATSVSARPDWKRVTGAHAYSWHENRLHALERLVHGGKARVVGRWSVPVQLGGKVSVITGTLSYVPAPRRWVWPVAAIAAAAVALAVAVRRRGTAEVVLSGVALAAALVARLGRELYGRPEVPTVSLAVAALSCLVAVALLGGLLAARGERRQLVVLVIGGFALYQGLTLVSVLTRGVLRSRWRLRAPPRPSLSSCSPRRPSGLARQRPRRLLRRTLELLGDRGFDRRRLCGLGHDESRPADSRQAGYDDDRRDQVEEIHCSHSMLLFSLAEVWEETTRA
jgi:hypothetical protein